MQWIVCPISPPPVRAGANGGLEMDRKDVVKEYFTDAEVAKRAANAQALKNPGVQYGVFGVLDIFEALPPPPPKMLHKKINEHGEVVVA